MGPLMTKAWEAFEKAARFEKLSQDTNKSESAQGVASRACERKLDEAVELEKAALAAGESH